MDQLGLDRGMVPYNNFIGEQINSWHMEVPNGSMEVYSTKNVWEGQIQPHPFCLPFQCPTTTLTGTT